MELFMRNRKKPGLFARLFGSKFFFIEVDEGLKEDEIMAVGHRVYVGKNSKINKNTQCS